MALRRPLHSLQVNLCLRRCLNSYSRRLLSSNQYQEFKEQEDGSLYEGHRPTSFLQKSILSIGSALLALRDPTRVDMVATLGETTGHYALRNMQLKMLRDPTGQRIIREKPIVDSSSVDLEILQELPSCTFGRIYSDFMIKQGITAEGRDPVQFVDNAELAYIMKRYRQIHDFIHCLLGVPTISVPGELAVKWFEFAHFGLPMNGLSAAFGPLAVSRDERKALTELVPWALQNGANSKFLLNVYFEEEMSKDIDLLREELNICPAPITLL